MNWIVKVYKDDNTVAESWRIENRSENEATKEAESEVEARYPGLDWTLTRN